MPVAAKPEDALDRTNLVLDGCNFVLGFGHRREQGHEIGHGRGEAVDRLGEWTDGRRQPLHHLYVMVNRRRDMTDGISRLEDLALGSGEWCRGLMLGDA